MGKIKDFYNQNKLEFILLILILLIGAFFRLYRIGEYMTFLGDEGRDAIIVRRLLTEFDLILIGPGTSIGNMYLGPLYYYLIAPSLFIFNFSPIGPSIFIALIGVLTIFLVWYVGRDWFGGRAGLIASFLYSISPTVIIYSRSSWNPNIMPFFSLLSVYSIWKVWKDRSYSWLLVLSVSVSFCLQSHYLALLLVPFFAIIWFLALWETRWAGGTRRLLIYSFWSFLLFLFLMSPLLIFDIRHGWINFNAMRTFFSVRQTTVSARPWTAIPNMLPIWEEFVTRILAGRNEILGRWTSLSFLGVLLWIVGKTKLSILKREYWAYSIIAIWIGISLVGFGVYKQEIYDHYYGIIFTSPFLLAGGMMDQLIDNHKIRGVWISAFGLLFLTYFNLIENPLRYPPNRQLQRTVEVARRIEKEAGSMPFNLAVIAERNYEDAYQYFLEKWGSGVTDIDPLNSEETIKSQLFVVCELPREKCDPTHNPKAEVANFGWSRVDEVWEETGVTVFKLVHTKGEE